MNMSKSTKFREGGVRETFFNILKNEKKTVSESGGHIFWTPFLKTVKNPMYFRWWQKAVFPTELHST